MWSEKFPGCSKKDIVGDLGLFSSSWGTIIASGGE